MAIPASDSSALYDAVGKFLTARACDFSAEVVELAGAFDRVRSVKRAKRVRRQLNRSLTVEYDDPTPDPFGQTLTFINTDDFVQGSDGVYRHREP